MSKHEFRAFLRMLIEVMREDKCHRRLRHAILRAIERSYRE